MKHFATVALLVSLVAGMTTGTQATTHQVNIQNFAYSPAALTITEGDTVRWTNQDTAPHTVTASGGGFDSGYLGNGQSWSYVFTTAGTYNYFCYYHPGMAASVEVQAAQPTAHEIAITGFQFQPATLTIQPGETVRWTNNDSAPHTATASNGTFDSGNLGQGQSYSFTFTTPGTYPYVCIYHSGMTGVIIVEGGSTAVLHEVTILQFAFDPPTLDIQPGDTVRWTNLDFAPHTATATDGSFDSGNLNAGQSYSYVFNTEGSFPYVCLYHSNMTGVINVGQQGGNSEWVEAAQPTTLPLNDVRFWDENLGWAAGDQGVFRTTDGGESWTQTPSGADVEAVYFISATEGWLCGNDGLIMHSTDGGQSWTSQTSGVGEKLRDIWFLDGQHGWAVGRDGILIHTANGGLNWAPQTSPATDDLRGLYFLDSVHGWAVGSDGLILHTHDLGQNWTTQLSVPGGEEDEFEAVYAVDHEHVWAAGGQGRIYHTTDGGTTWNAQESGTTVALMDIYFTDENNGWVCGAGGFLAMTMDGGATWSAQTPPVFSTFNALYFVNSNLGYMVSADGRVLKYLAVPEGTEPGHHHVSADQFHLAANYPNPFNPQTTIEFTVATPGMVQLTVFDILGRSVATLVQAPLQAGTHRAQFSGAGLPSGLYFYRLQAGGSVQTRTMTLLK